SRLNDGTDMGWRTRITPVSRNPTARVMTTQTAAASSESLLARDASPMSAPLDIASRKNEVVKEGRTKRCLYLFASCSVDDPYSWTYLKNAFITMEPTISAMEAARTN